MKVKIRPNWTTATSEAAKFILYLELKYEIVAKTSREARGLEPSSGYK